MERDRVHWFLQLADLEEEADAEEPSGAALCATGGADSDCGVPPDRTAQVEFDMKLDCIYLCTCFMYLSLYLSLFVSLCCCLYHCSFLCISLCVH